MNSSSIGTLCLDIDLIALPSSPFEIWLIVFFLAIANRDMFESPLKL